MFLNARYINAINNKRRFGDRNDGAVAEENVGKTIGAVDRGKDCHISPQGANNNNAD